MYLLRSFSSAEGKPSPDSTPLDPHSKTPGLATDINRSEMRMMLWLPSCREAKTVRAGEFSRRCAELLPPLPAHAGFPLPGRRRPRVCATPTTRIDPSRLSTSLLLGMHVFKRLNNRSVDSVAEELLFILLIQLYSRAERQNLHRQQICALS